MKRPAVVVVTRRTARKNLFINYVGELHLNLLVRLKLLPLMVPVVSGAEDCVAQYSEQMRGLLLVEGEDIEPRRYKAEQANINYLEKIDPIKDEIEIDFLHRAIKRKIPILGICRGSQLLNVVSGGSLYGDVQKEKDSPLKHINFESYDSYRHPIQIVPRTPLERWYGRRPTLQVNSYHHQGVRNLAPRFKPMAHAEDGLVEGYYDPKEPFVIGLQFHPERMLEEAEGNWHLWTAFGTAVHRRVARGVKRG